MAFLDLVDRSGRIQLQARVDVLGPQRMERAARTSTSATSSASTARVRRTRGELTLRVDDFTVLAKALRPPPDKHHGLDDVETRFRRRELDLMANADARDLRTRAQVVAAIRRYLDEEGFIEVETPVLQPLYGGAAARPFVTHHNALDRDFYLRIATELYLKRLSSAAWTRVRDRQHFRNEGVSYKHNPEFTMVEGTRRTRTTRTRWPRRDDRRGRSPRRAATRGAIDFSRRGVASRCATRSSSTAARRSPSRARDEPRRGDCAAGLEGIETEGARGRSWSTT